MEVYPQESSLEIWLQNHTVKALAPEFDREAALHAKSLIILMVPMFALGAFILEWRRRRYYVEHLIFSLHFYAFWLLFTASSLFLIRHLAGLMVRHGATVNARHLDGYVTLFGLVCIAIYLFFALRAFYGDGRTAALIKAVLLSVSTAYVIIAYRFILFLTTLYLS